MVVEAPAPPPVPPEDIEAARVGLAGVARVTPMTISHALSARIGGEVWLKCENLQHAGSFKIRGAYTRLAALPQEQRHGGVVAASAGNHAQGVALAARRLGIPARVFMPVGAPLPKVRATIGYGAEVSFAGQTVDEALRAAREWSERTGSVLVHPFDHPDVVAGQGTLGLEILDQCPQVRTVVVAVGGGGLLSGVAAVVRARRPDVEILGVQARGAAAFPPSLAAGHPVELPTMSTMADGIAVGRPGELTFAMVSALASHVVTVDEELISQALLLLLERAKLVVEPAGAVPVAALLDPQVAPTVRPPAVLLLSGGNIDPLLLLRVIRHGMAAAGRYLQVRLRLADRPGSLAALLSVLAAARANVLEIAHVRTSPTISVDEVELALRLETQGPEHCVSVLAALEGSGYTLVP